MKKLFEVANAKSGHSFGYIAAKSEKEALDSVSKDAGYEGYEEACDVTGTDELVAEEVDIEDLVKGWVDQFMEENPNFRCTAQSELSKILANSNAPAFPTLPEECVDEAHDIAWNLFMAFWKERITEEAALRGLDMETLDPAGAGVDDWITWRVLEGASVADAVQDWVDWKKQDLEEREEGDA